MEENEELTPETTQPTEKEIAAAAEEARVQKSHNLHKESQRQYDIGQNAMCFVVLGALGVIIGIIFIFIALKRENNIIVGFDTGSLAFYLFIILLAVGGAALIYGLIRYFVSFFKRKKIIQEINNLK